MGAIPYEQLSGINPTDESGVLRILDLQFAKNFISTKTISVETRTQNLLQESLRPRTSTPPTFRKISNLKLFRLSRNELPAPVEGITRLFQSLFSKKFQHHSQESPFTPEIIITPPESITTSGV